MKIKRTRNYFQSDVFAAVAVLRSLAPFYEDGLGRVIYGSD